MISPRLGIQGLELKMNNIKSISTVKTTAGWAARQRNTDGTEGFVVCDGASGQRYTMHQAEMVADSLRRHLTNGGDTYAEPLPPGVRVLKS